MFEMPEIKRPEEDKIPILKIVLGNPWIFFALAAIITFGTIGLHTYPSAQALKQIKSENLSMEKEIITLEEQIKEKTSEQKGAANELELFSDKYNPRIEQALPFGEDLNELTRFIESYALQLEKAGTMTLSTISYGAAATEGDYSRLPIRLSFQADPLNFIRFMQLIQNSGSIEEKDFHNGQAVRLMQVDQISVSIPSFEDVAANSDNGQTNAPQEPLYTINIQLSAFFRPQA